MGTEMTTKKKTKKATNKQKLDFAENTIECILDTATRIFHLSKGTPKQRLKIIIESVQAYEKHKNDNDFLTQE